MDKAAGSIVSMIEEKGLANETIIIFTSDNGGLSSSKDTGHLTSGPLRGEKNNIWEGGHRVPLIMRYDFKFPAGKKRNRMVGLNDIYATICELVGIEVPVGSAQDSLSFANYIKNSNNKNGLREYLGMFQVNPMQDWQLAIRKGHLKVIHTPHNNTYEAYNLKHDISESKNIVDVPTVAVKIPEMLEKLKAIGPCPDKNRDGRFTIALIGKRRTCQWFRNKKHRCEIHVEGHLYCPSVCKKFYRICQKKMMYGNDYVSQPNNKVDEIDTS